ncbi:MAG: winged helix-turn-helix domain-containing protein [Methanomassiliicoccales archaeon]
MREVQQLRAGMITFNEKMANMRYDDFRQKFNSQMKEMLIREARSLFEEKFGFIEGSSTCKTRPKCLAAIRHIVDRSLDSINDDFQRSIDMLNQAEATFISNCLHCEDSACNHTVSQSLSRVIAVMAVYENLAKEMNESSKGYEQKDGSVTLSPDKMELMLYPLSSAMRLRIMLILMQGNRTLGELAENLKIKTGHLMFHVRALKDCGYIASDTRSRFYTLTERGRTAISCLGDMNRRIGEFDGPSLIVPTPVH